MGKLTSLLPLPAPKDSFTVVTSTLGAPSTWLCHAWACETLKAAASSTSSNSSSSTASGFSTGGRDGNGRETQTVQSVALVSFLNDERFHREGLRRGGIDSEKMEERGRFVYVDGLGGLFSAAGGEGQGQTQAPSIGTEMGMGVGGGGGGGGRGPVPGVGGRQVPSVRGAVPPRGGPQPPQPSQPQPPPSSQTSKHTQHLPHPNTPTSKPTTTTTTTTSPSNNPTFTALLTTLTTALTTLPTPPLLILDHPDLLLTTGLLTAHTLHALLLALAPHTHSLLLLLSSDTPILRPLTSLASTLFYSLPPPPLTSSPFPRIETECAAFMAMAVHNASLVLGLRLLDTGAARDVSGVMRITLGGDGVVEGVEGGGGWEGVQEREVLYYVGSAAGSAAVEVFERGEVRS